MCIAISVQYTMYTGIAIVLSNIIDIGIKYWLIGLFVAHRQIVWNGQVMWSSR